MSSGAGSRDVDTEDSEDFPECWTAADVMDELKRILDTWETFTNGTLRHIAASIESDMQENPLDFARHGIENAVDPRHLPYRNKLFLLLDLGDRHRFPFDEMNRWSDVLIRAIGLTKEDFEHWERSTVLTSSHDLSETETQVVLAILKLHQRLADIRMQPVPVLNYNRNGRGPGDGGGGGPGGVANLNFRIVGASVPRDFAPMRAMLLDL
jgi:hypothetical protein